MILKYFDNIVNERLNFNKCQIVSFIQHLLVALISAARALFFTTLCKFTLFSAHSPGCTLILRTFGKSASSQVPKWLTAM